jgi:hypothetical protein
MGTHVFKPAAFISPGGDIQNLLREAHRLCKGNPVMHTLQRRGTAELPSEVHALVADVHLGYVII